MTNDQDRSTRTFRVPELLRPVFWDQDFHALDGQEHRDFIIRRVLVAGPWDAILRLRSQLGDRELRACIERTKAADSAPSSCVSGKRSSICLPSRWRRG